MTLEELLETPEVKSPSVIYIDYRESFDDNEDMLKAYLSGDEEKLWEHTMDWYVDSKYYYMQSLRESYPEIELLSEDELEVLSEAIDENDESEAEAIDQLARNSSNVIVTIDLYPTEEQNERFDLQLSYMDSKYREDSVLHTSYYDPEDDYDRKRRFMLAIASRYKLPLSAEFIEEVAANSHTCSTFQVMMRMDIKDARDIYTHGGKVKITNPEIGLVDTINGAGWADEVEGTIVLDVTKGKAIPEPLDVGYTWRDICGGWVGQVDTDILALNLPVADAA